MRTWKRTVSKDDAEKNYHFPNTWVLQHSDSEILMEQRLTIYKRMKKTIEEYKNNLQKKKN